MVTAGAPGCDAPSDWLPTVLKVMLVVAVEFDSLPVKVRSGGMTASGSLLAKWTVWLNPATALPKASCARTDAGCGEPALALAGKVSASTVAPGTTATLAVQMNGAAEESVAVSRWPPAVTSVTPVMREPASAAW